MVLLNLARRNASFDVSKRESEKTFKKLPLVYLHLAYGETLRLHNITRVLLLLTCGIMVH